MPTDGLGVRSQLAGGRLIEAGPSPLAYKRRPIGIGFPRGHLDPPHPNGSPCPSSPKRAASEIVEEADARQAGQDVERAVKGRQAQSRQPRRRGPGCRRGCGGGSGPGGAFLFRRQGRREKRGLDGFRLIRVRRRRRRRRCDYHHPKRQRPNEASRRHSDRQTPISEEKRTGSASGGRSAVSDQLPVLYLRWGSRPGWISTGNCLVLGAANGGGRKRNPNILNLK